MRDQIAGKRHGSGVAAAVQKEDMVVVDCRLHQAGGRIVEPALLECSGSQIVFDNREVVGAYDYLDLDFLLAMRSRTAVSEHAGIPLRYRYRRYEGRLLKVGIDY